MNTIDDGGKIEIVKENHKVVMEIVDNGGLDGSPPDGVSVWLNLEDVDELITALQSISEGKETKKIVYI